VKLVRDLPLPCRIANVYAGANIITHKPSTDSPYSVDQMIKTLKEAGCDAMCIIPPAHKNKFTITQELIVAIKEENIQNILFMSNTGGEMAERSEQPHLRDFTDLECLVMAEDKKGEKVTGQSHVIVRGGFCAEVCAQSLWPPSCWSPSLTQNYRTSSGTPPELKPMAFYPSLSSLLPCSRLSL
jgi:hypothetical protein